MTGNMKNAKIEVDALSIWSFYIPFLSSYKGKMNDNLVLIAA